MRINSLEEGSQIAFISGSPVPVTHMVRQCPQYKTTYYGTKAEIKVLEDFISSDESVSSLISVFHLSDRVAEQERLLENESSIMENTYGVDRGLIEEGWGKESANFVEVGEEIFC